MGISSYSLSKKTYSCFYKRQKYNLILKQILLILENLLEYLLLEGRASGLPAITAVWTLSTELWSLTPDLYSKVCRTFLPVPTVRLHGHLLIPFPLPELSFHGYYLLPSINHLNHTRLESSSFNINIENQNFSLVLIHVIKAKPLPLH